MKKLQKLAAALAVVTLIISGLAFHTSKAQVVIDVQPLLEKNRPIRVECKRWVNGGWQTVAYGTACLPVTYQNWCQPDPCPAGTTVIDRRIPSR